MTERREAHADGRTATPTTHSGQRTPAAVNITRAMAIGIAALLGSGCIAPPIVEQRDEASRSTRAVTSASQALSARRGYPGFSVGFTHSRGSASAGIIVERPGVVGVHTLEISIGGRQSAHTTDHLTHWDRKTTGPYRRQRSRSTNQFNVPLDTVLDMYDTVKQGGSVTLTTRDIEGREMMIDMSRTCADPDHPYDGPRDACGALRHFVRRAGLR